MEAIKKIDGVDIVEGTYEAEGISEIDNKEVISKVLCIDELNKVFLVDGNLPQNTNECVVEENFLLENNKKIGDTIKIDIEDVKDDDGNEIQYLYNNEMKIVGTVKSPLYISNERGSSSLGDGKIDYYIYVPKENIQSKTYTNIYVKLKDIDKYETASSKYEDYVSDVKDKIEEIKSEREKARHDELVQKATDKVNEAEKEFNDKKQEADSKISDAQKEIDDGKAKIANSEAEIQTNEQKANSEFTKAEQKIASAKKEIQDNENILQEKEKELNNSLTELEKQRQELVSNKEVIEEQLPVIENTYNSILKQLENDELNDIMKSELEKQKKQLEEQIDNLNSNLKTINEGIIRNR